MTRRKDPETVTETTVDGADPVALALDPVTPEAIPPEPPPVAQPAQEVAPARRPGVLSGALGPVLGGALAALGGFGLSHFDVFGLAAPDRSTEVADLGQRLDAAVAGLQTAQTGLESSLGQAIDGLEARIAGLETAPAVDLTGVADLEQRLAAIEALPPGGDASTAALAAKLAELERQVAAQPAGGAASAEVEAALARLAEVEVEAKARADEAAAMTEALAQARAFEVLAAAVGAGAAFEAELAAVADTGLQSALAPHVAGVATLAELQADFPEGARAALQLARASDTEAGWGARIVDFLGAQTGARSLTPREGDDPDAILSRAEFALGEGRLADALAELDALDADLRVPLEEWITVARARVAVDAALAGAL